MSNKKLVEKNLKLSADFSAYVSNNPKIVEDLPRDFCVVFEVKNDEALSSKNLDLAKQMERKGEKCYVASKTGGKWQIKESVSAVR